MATRKKSTKPAQTSSSTPGSKVNREATDNYMVGRLKEQLKVSKMSLEIHLNERLLDEMAFYPAHDKRLETPEYHKAHDHLTKKLDLPCLVCGVRNSTLNDPVQNRYDAKQMETHHHVIEWALANAIDTDKFNRVLLPHLAQRHKANRAYRKPFTQEQVRAWVDHSEDNLWVLCDVHHRAKYFGIHEITFPIWGPMDLLRPDFEQYVNDQIEKANADKKGRKSAKKVSVL
ncbi:MAG TPA: hypothetical protein VG844_13745 [Terracidiphilus sp.]|nr:hypothetical protein [Terracidiphilus sp.]